MNPSSQPKVSVITINLNNKNGLRKTIESVVSQTQKDFEYIVIDGASTDGSVDVINEYQTKIHYRISEKDAGIYNAMNKGIQAAKGDYVLFLNSGDWLVDKDVLEKTIQLINPNAAVCAADIYYDNGNSLVLRSNPLNFSCINHLLIGGLFHQSTFIKRKMFEKYGLYNETKRIAADWEFFTLILVLNPEMYQHIPIPLAAWDSFGISNEQTMQAILKQEREEVLNRLIPLPILNELASIQVKLTEHNTLKEKLNGRRYRLLEQIEKSKLMGRIITIPMMICSKLANLIARL